MPKADAHAVSDQNFVQNSAPIGNNTVLFFARSCSTRARRDHFGINIPSKSFPELVSGSGPLVY